MKLAVYDSKNTERLLGYLEYNGRVVDGHFHRLPVIPQPTSTSTFYRENLPPSKTQPVVDVRVITKTDRTSRQLTPAVRETTITERTMLTTPSDLSLLVQIRGFTLPRMSDENQGRTEERQESYAEAQRGYLAVYKDY